MATAIKAKSADIEKKLSITDAQLKKECADLLSANSDRMAKEKAHKTAPIPDELHAEILKEMAILGPRNMGFAIGLTHRGLSLEQAQLIIDEYEEAQG